MPLGPHVWMPKIPSLLLILARGRGVSKVLGIGSMVSGKGYLIKNALVFSKNKLKSLEILVEGKADSSPLFELI